MSVPGATAVSVRRNDPCPCGGGKKYKHCCLPREARRRAVQSARREGLSRALRWLEKRYPEELERALDEDYFAGVGRRALQKTVAGLAPKVSGMVQSNAREWLLAEAKLRLPDGEAYARDLVLGPGGAALPASERSWVEAMSQAHLGLYEADAVRPGEGLSLRDLLRGGDEPVWVPDRVASETVREGEALGARLAREGEGEAWGFSGALYPFPPVAVPSLLEELRGADADPGGAPSGRERRWRTIVGHWLRLLSTAGRPEAGAAELLGGSADEGRAEVRGRFLRESLRGFYEDWADAPLPALGGKTPREAVESPEGREAVRSLLRTYEADEAAMAARQQREPLDFGFLWEAVDLDRPEA